MPTELPKQTAANKLFNVFASAVAASKRVWRRIRRRALCRAPRSACAALAVLPRTRSLLGVGAGGSSAGADPAVVRPTARSLSATTKPRVDAANGREQEAPSISVRLRLPRGGGSGAAHAAVLAAEPYDSELRGFAHARRHPARSARRRRRERPRRPLLQSG